ncbi:MAG: CIA30 family protein [Candidatus Cyclobacteriaceae bacterium M2_1C_046]
MTKILFDFKNNDASGWKVVDDEVMGGQSSGRFYISETGSAVFEGAISLENNGGFSSVRQRFDTVEVKDFNKIIIRIKGDGKPYKFKVKENTNDEHTYKSMFSTTGDWQTVEIPFSALNPYFRGKKLDLPFFNGYKIQEVGFLFGNGKAEKFKLELEKIELT